MTGFEVDRTASNLIEVERGRKSRRKPMKHGEWSKSIELDRTLTLVSILRGDMSAEDEKSGSLRCPARLDGMMGFEAGRTLAPGF